MSNSWMPNKKASLDLLLKAAERAANESAANHPEDLAIAMIAALEVAYPVIMDSYKKFNKDDQ